MNASDLRLVYKHSSTCDLSLMAAMEVGRFVSARQDVPVHTLDVHADRAACQQVERDTGIRHESPQILLVRGDEVLWHASHRRVTSAAISAAVDAALGAAPDAATAR
jgi:thioredoxin 1